MSGITIYEDVNYGGESFILTPGSWSRTDLLNVGYGQFHDNISSIRIPRNMVVLITKSMGPSSGNSRRVLLGPRNIPDLSVLGLNDSINYLSISRIRDSNYGQEGRATLYSNYSFTGLTKTLHEGEYNKARIQSREANQSGLSQVLSIDVDSNTLVILYDNDNFDDNGEAVYIIGPQRINLDAIDMSDKMESLKVLSLDGNPPTDPVKKTAYERTMDKIVERRKLYNYYGASDASETSLKRRDVAATPSGAGSTQKSAGAEAGVYKSWKFSELKIEWYILILLFALVFASLVYLYIKLEKRDYDVPGDR